MSADEAATPKTTSGQLDALFAPWNRADAPGLVVGVSHEGRVIYRRGFGMASLETFAANGPRTRMRIGSTSKHFTGLLALLLAEDGKLDMDAPIRAYVPELTGPGGDPTVRQLLGHRGGSRCYLDIGFIGHGMALAAKGVGLAAQARQQGRNFGPGEAMIYNNGGYHLVSIAIERVGGAPFEDQLKTRLFDPVGMPDTASIPTDYEITPGVATMHLPLPGGGWRRGLFPSEEVRGEGAIVSTIDDMLRWTAHLRRRDRFGRPESWAQLTELPTYADGAKGAYALGLMIGQYRGLNIVHHAGGVIGGSCQMLTLPDEGLDVIIIANGAPAANPVRLAEQVVDIVLADKVGPEAPAVTAEAHKGLVGDWWSPETGMIYTFVEDPEKLLKLNVGMPYPLPLEPTADGAGLVSPASSIGELRFEPVEGGLRASFGGRSAVYRKIDKADGDTAAFAAAATGTYESADADATAVLAQEGERLVLRMRDPWGQVEATLIPMGEDVAATQPVDPLSVAFWAITLVREAGRVTGLRLNTMRTRDLAFVRR